ncbi:MAG: C-terminal helicase domain-containing protein, partial [Acidobacteriota bacterium]
IDKPNIRYVTHYNLAKSLENLSQEIGRAGRDGEPAVCESFVCPEDLPVLRNFAYGDTPSREGIRGLVDELAETPDHFDVSYQELANRHDIRVLVVRTLLTYLELQGYLEAGTPTYASYRFKPLLTSMEILAKFQGERREFLARLFRQAKKARTWFDLDLESAGRALGAPRTRLVGALDYLAEQQMMELKVGGLRHRYRWLRRILQPKAVVEELFERTELHERRENERLDLVLELAGHDGCQTALLCDYFGETLEDACGHCGWCLDGRQAIELPTVAEPSIDEEVWRQAVELRSEHPHVLGDPRAFSRFLTGLKSPRLTRAKLSSHPLFGVWDRIPFTIVLERAASDAS